MDCSITATTLEGVWGHECGRAEEWSVAYILKQG